MKKTIIRATAIMATLSVLAAGCSGKEPPAPEGYVDIDTEVGNELDTEVIEEDLHMAESVPYVEPEEKMPDEDDAASKPEETEEASEEVKEDYLPGYPTEDDWKSRHTGSASYIFEPTVIISIFVDEEEDVWTPEEKAKALEICSIGYEYIKDTLKEEYDTEVELFYDWTEDPELAYSTRIYEDIPAYVTSEQERYLDKLEAEWVENTPYRELCLKYNTSSVGFLYFVPHEGCSYSSMHFIDDGNEIWNEGCLLYLQDMYSPTYDYETPTVYAHELLHLFGAEDFYSSAEVFSDETYDMLKEECPDDIMLRTFIEVDGVYTTFPDEVYGEITPVTAYLLGIGDDTVVKDIPELIRSEAACFPGSVYDRPF